MPSMVRYQRLARKWLDSIWAQGRRGTVIKYDELHGVVAISPQEYDFLHGLYTLGIHVALDLGLRPVAIEEISERAILLIKATRPQWLRHRKDIISMYYTVVDPRDVPDADREEAPSQWDRLGRDYHD